MSQGFTKGTPIDTDPTLSLNSDIVVPSQAAVVAYIASQVGTPVTNVTATAPLVSSLGPTPNLSIPAATSLINGYLSAADWAMFNAKQNAISLTTTGSSGASTFISNTLNVPTYTLSGLGGVPTTRTITIDGTTWDLSADRTYATTGSRQSALVNMVTQQVGASTNTFTSIATATPSAFNATEIVRQSVFGTAVSFTRLTIVTQGVPQSATGSLTIVLRVNGVDTALSYTILPTTVPGVFTVSGTVPVGPTDRVSIRCQNAATVNSQSIVAITTTFTI